MFKNLEEIEIEYHTSNTYLQNFKIEYQDSNNNNDFIDSYATNTNKPTAMAMGEEDELGLVFWRSKTRRDWRTSIRNAPLLESSLVAILCLKNQ